MATAFPFGRIAVAVALLFSAAGAASASYVNFETVPVRPLALAPSGTKLFAVNTPDGRLEVFDVLSSGLILRGSVAVGLDPVAVAARSESEVWVVNHLSDTVSIVDVSTDPPRVVRTVPVGDEPWDVVFAHPDPNDVPQRAFVTAARRGQHHPGDPLDPNVPTPKAELKTAGVGRADVWVFDVDALGSSLDASPEAIVQLFGDKPRALAVSPDGATVYAGIFKSGNRTTAVNELGVCDGGQSAPACMIPEFPEAPVTTGVGGLPDPNQNQADGAPAAETSLIVKWRGDPNDPNAPQAWRDELQRVWDVAVPFTLPDRDVFAIDATANPPAETGYFVGVGTVLFAMAAHPTNGKLYVANTEARNDVRFEGPGSGVTTVRGHLAEARVSVLQSPGSVAPRHLNNHIDYSAVPVPAGVADRSLSTPTGLAFSADGTKVYVTGLGSNRLAVYAVAGIDADTFTPDPNDHIPLSGGGPAGLVRDDTHGRLYVYTRFDNGISIVDLASESEIGTHALHSPEPAVVTRGRKFLYDATLTSSNGEASCAACHIFGDKDELAWDLGDPSNGLAPNPNPFITPIAPEFKVFNPMKGPMTTQTLRGMDDHGPMHWRGDRTTDPNTGGDPLDEQLSFKEFNVAFGGLLGRDAGPLDDPNMTAYADFALTIVPPPNPHRNLDNSLEAIEAQGETVFRTTTTDGGTCINCHVLDPNQGFFGTSGLSSFEGEKQLFKIAHLRNMYDKVGMFGTTSGASGPTGDQIRGFGFLHDGTVATLTDFLSAVVFNFPGGASQRESVVDFMFVFPSNLAPIVGQQATLTPTSDASVADHVTLLRERALDPFAMKGNPSAKECELVVKGVIAGVPRSWRLDPDSVDPNDPTYQDDLGGTISESSLRALATTPGQELTFTCTYPVAGAPSAGERMGLDRDLDGVLDAEQCGDVNGDAIVTSDDPTLVRLQLAGLPATLTTADKCNVHGTPGGAPTLCTLVDVVVAERSLLGLGPGRAQVCGPALL